MMNRLFLSPRLSLSSNPAAANRAARSAKTLWSVAGAAVVSIGLWASPSLAKDPFRTSDVRPISDQTETAFRALFEQGDYTKAARNLQQAESTEPLAQALRAVLAYTDWQSTKDPARLEAFRSYADKTRQTAKGIAGSDPLRANLYQAVGHFLESAYLFSTNSSVKGTPQVLNEIQQAFKYMDEAEKVSPSDPELNTLKGFIDLFVSTNLPFSSPSKAIERLEKLAGPRYLADRGVALGYRDLNKQDKALAAVDRAIKLTPSNPELFYLKAQILVRQGNRKDSIQWFEKALKQKNQLPPGVVKQINKEMERAKR